MATTGTRWSNQIEGGGLAVGNIEMAATKQDDY